MFWDLPFFFFFLFVFGFLFLYEFSQILTSGPMAGRAPFNPFLGCTGYGRILVWGNIVSADMVSLGPDFFGAATLSAELLTMADITYSAPCLLPEPMWR